MQFLQSLKDNAKLFATVAILILLALNLFFAFKIFKNNNNLKLYFLDVGQGDAIFIETPLGAKILIDTGNSPQALFSELDKILGLFSRKIDYLFLSHFDKDHTGASKELLKYYKVDNLYLPAYSKESFNQWLDLKNFAESKNINILNLKRGDILEFQSGLYLIVFSPAREGVYKNDNQASLVLKLLFGNTSALFVADAPAKLEKTLAFFDKSALKSDILKLGHHGSKTSSAREFLKFVDPKFAIVSAGDKNRYKHPHKEVIERVKNLGIKILETKNGTIKFESNGLFWRLY